LIIVGEKCHELLKFKEFPFSIFGEENGHFENWRGGIDPLARIYTLHIKQTILTFNNKFTLLLKQQ